jgi:hypothetical protein
VSRRPLTARPQFSHMSGRWHGTICCFTSCRAVFLVISNLERRGRVVNTPA